MEKAFGFKDRFIGALLRKKVDRVPVLSVTQTGTVELMAASGAYWPEAHRNAELMARLALAAHEVAGFEAVRVPFGIYAEAEDLGCKVDYHEDRVDFTPTVIVPVSDVSSLEATEPMGDRMRVVADAVKFLANKVGADVPIVAGVTGPFTLACLVSGTGKLMKSLVLKPEYVYSVLELAADVVAKFCNILSDEGATAITLVEPTVSIIGAKFFGKFALPYIRKVKEGMKSPFILHVCGKSVPIMHLMVETGVEGISIDHLVSVGEALKLIGNKASLIGNVNPVELLQAGKPEDVKRESRRIIEEGIDILAPGCGLSPHTPLANMKAMVEVAKEYDSQNTLKSL